MRMDASELELTPPESSFSSLEGDCSIINNPHTTPTHIHREKLHPNCLVLVRRLREYDREQLIRDLPTKITKIYPTMNPDDNTTMYDEIYSLVNTSLLNKSYKFRVYYFLNIFLSSSKVPAYVIFAYVKRLSRMSLYAKDRSLVSILRLVGNIFIRHPVLIKLRDKVNDRATEFESESDHCTIQSWLDTDPFDYKEHNLKYTNALNSCIWELMPLRYHKHPKVARAAQYLNETKIPEMEFDLDPLVR